MLFRNLVKLRERVLRCREDVVLRLVGVLSFFISVFSREEDCFVKIMLLFCFLILGFMVLVKRILSCVFNVLKRGWYSEGGILVDKIFLMVLWILMLVYVRSWMFNFRYWFNSGFLWFIEDNLLIYCSLLMEGFLWLMVCLVV